MNIYIILLESTDTSKGQNVDKVHNDNKYYITKSDVKNSEDILKVYTKPKEVNLSWMKKYKPTTEQIKEKNRKAYLKRKEKLENENLLK